MMYTISSSYHCGHHIAVVYKQRSILSTHNTRCVHHNVVVYIHRYTLALCSYRQCGHVINVVCNKKDLYLHCHWGHHINVAHRSLYISAQSTMILISGHHCSISFLFLRRKGIYIILVLPPWSSHHCGLKEEQGKEEDKMTSLCYSFAATVGHRITVFHKKKGVTKAIPVVGWFGL